MLSAIVASTGAARHVHEPSAASASVRLCATVKAVMVRPGADVEPTRMQQGQHEQQVVEAEQDVLDAEAQVRPGEGEGARGGGHHERRRRRRQAVGLLRAVAALDAEQDVGERRAEALHGDGMAIEPAGASHGGTLDEGVAGPRVLARCNRGAVRGQCRPDAEALVASRGAATIAARHVGLRPAQLQVAGAQLRGLRLPARAPAEPTS